MTLLKIKQQHATGAAGLGNMKINEIISESTKKKPPKRFQDSTRGLHRFGLESHSTYAMYRTMLAAASSNGVDAIPDHVDPESWVGRDGVAVPFTQEEQNMLKKAYERVGTDYKDLNRGDLRSMELPIVNKASPVATRKTNKYGV